MTNPNGTSPLAAAEAQMSAAFAIPEKPTLSSNGSSGGKKDQRLIVVSNRLPVTIDKDDKGEYHFKVSELCVGIS